MMSHKSRNQSDAPNQPEHKQPVPESHEPTQRQQANVQELPKEAVAVTDNRDVLQVIRESFDRANHRHKLFMSGEDLDRLRVQLSEIELLPMDTRYIRTQPVPEGALYNIDGIWIYADGRMRSGDSFRLERDENPA